MTSVTLAVIGRSSAYDSVRCRLQMSPTFSFCRRHLSTTVVSECEQAVRLLQTTEFPCQYRMSVLLLLLLLLSPFVQKVQTLKNNQHNDTDFN